MHPVLVSCDVFSNPYVDVARRKRDADTMLADLTSGKPEKFRELARAYGVRYVALPPQQRVRSKQRGLSLTRVYRSTRRTAGFDVYEVELN
jgi:hypothetical protein